MVVEHMAIEITMNQAEYDKYRTLFPIDRLEILKLNGGTVRVHQKFDIQYLDGFEKRLSYMIDLYNNNQITDGKLFNLHEAESIFVSLLDKIRSTRRD